MLPAVTFITKIFNLDRKEAFLLEALFGIFDTYKTYTCRDRNSIAFWKYRIPFLLRVAQVKNSKKRLCNIKYQRQFKKKEWKKERKVWLKFSNCLFSSPPRQRSSARCVLVEIYEHLTHYFLPFDSIELFTMALFLNYVRFWCLSS